MGNGFAVRHQDRLATPKRASQHQKGRTGQMKVGEQASDHAKLEAGIDEKIGRAAPGGDAL